MPRSSAFLLIVLATLPLYAEDWPQFRGPGGTGIGAAKLPTEWDAEKNVAWKTAIPGRGLSSPVVWGDRVFVTSAIQGGGRNPNVQWCVLALDRITGKVLWKQVALEGKPRSPIQSGNSYATETPVTDGERVYAFFGNHGLFCYDFAGCQGTGSSPTFDGGRLILQVDNEEKSFLVAVDGKTGEELWRMPRDERTNYSSPIVWKNKLGSEVVTSGSNAIRSYDPATGKLLWELALGGGRCPASPTGDDERLYVGGGGGGGPSRGRGKSLFCAVRAGAKGDISLKSGQNSNEGIAWSQPRGDLEMASPLAFHGHVYILSQSGGLVSCLDAKTGKTLYRERLPNAQNFWASPWAAGGHVYALDSAGTTFLLEDGPEFELLARNKLKDKCWATPAAAGGSLFLRGNDTVYCIRP
jgi:outer membrane protein assembly factor BamB